MTKNKTRTAYKAKRAVDFPKVNDTARPAPRKHSILSVILIHTQRVSVFAEQIFEQTIDLHNLSISDKKILVSASLLHDIGFVRGRPKHHKTSEIIIRSAASGLATFELVGNDDLRNKVDMTLESILDDHSAKEISLIALIARYHRKSEPRLEHKKFKALSEQNRELVRVLSAIVRVADALDYSHRRDVRKINLIVEEKKIVLQLFGEKAAWKEEVKRVEAKKGLFEEVFKRTLECQIVSKTKKKEKKAE